ncbi:UNVERIFIED_CONTAM: hypothetical protein FKN15_022139 [Acipenser sinensis]
MPVCAGDATGVTVLGTAAGEAVGMTGTPAAAVGGDTGKVAGTAKYLQGFGIRIKMFLSTDSGKPPIKEVGYLEKAALSYHRKSSAIQMKLACGAMFFVSPVIGPVF